MSKYKALMLDLDGTTIPNNPTGMPSQKVIEAIAKAQQRLSVCIVTARYLNDTTPILDALHITTPVILLGGSQIIDGTTRNFIYEQPLESQDISKILSIIRQYNVPTKIREKSKAVEYTPSYVPEKPFAIFVFNSSEEMVDMLAVKISHILTITAHKILSWRSGKFCLSISHAIATKQHAIFEVSKTLGIKSEEMIGIGDGYNDFPLLMACGFKVAMGNAVDELKAIADYIAPPIEQDGVADVIEKFVL